jgi:insertion element IS1 protein InsB
MRLSLIARKHHRELGKETDQTNPIEKLNNTFRQRISKKLIKSSPAKVKK